MSNGGAQAEPRQLSFTIELNARGFWVARERGGLIEGVFPSQGEAIRFALIELARANSHSPLARAA